MATFRKPLHLPQLFPVTVLLCYLWESPAGVPGGNTSQGFSFKYFASLESQEERVGSETGGWSAKRCFCCVYHSADLLTPCSKGVIVQRCLVLLWCFFAVSNRTDFFFVKSQKHWRHGFMLISENSGTSPLGRGDLCCNAACGWRSAGSADLNRSPR